MRSVSFPLGAEDRPPAIVVEKEKQRIKASHSSFEPSVLCQNDDVLMWLVTHHPSSGTTPIGLTMKKPACGG